MGLNEQDLVHNTVATKPSPLRPPKRSGAVRVINIIDNRFEEIFIFIGFVVFILLINAQVINRYLMPFVEIANITTWTEEVSRYIFIWISYLGASLAIKKKESIRIDFLTRNVSESFQRSLNVANALFMLYFSYVLIDNGFATIIMQLTNDQTSPAMGISMVIPYSAIPVGFGLIGIRLIQSMWIDLKSMRIRDIFIALLITGIMIIPVFIVDSPNIGFLLFGYFVLFIVIGMPIAFALGVSALATVVATGAIPLNFFSQAAFTSIDNFPILAIPFFIAAGIIMGEGSLIKRLLRLSDELVGFLPGGLAIVAVLTSMFFSAISGSGPATVAAIGTLLIPTMIKQGYNPAFATALVAAAGSIGVIIPPSTPFIIYGVVAQQSISQLFIAGIIPGLLIGVGLILVAIFISKKNKWQGESTSFNVKNTVRAAWDAKLALLVPIFILGGIYGGIMTPTEAAAVAALYGVIVGVFIYRDLDAKKLYSSLVNSGLVSSVIIMLIAMATIFGRLITVERLAETVASTVLSLSENKFLILLLINLFLLVVGCVMEALAAIVILTPILMPIVLSLGVDPVHFGLIMVFNLAIGFITPPVGVNLFVAASITKLRIEQVVTKISPFLFAMIAILMLLTYVPEITLWLVQFMR